MPFYHILILSIVQGLTEFLPVSSSGHLVLAHAALGHHVDNLCWSQDKVLDIAVHVGTLFSVLLYFRQDVCTLIRGVLKLGSLSRKTETAPETRLLLFLVVSSFPVIIAGFFLHAMEPSWFCMVEITAWTTLIFGIVLWLSDQHDDNRELKTLDLKGALFIGLSQILALIPGTSRSGITMTAARYLGFSRTEAARYSLLLGIVAISGAGVLEGASLWQSGNLDLSLSALIGAFLAFVTGWISIKLMMSWLSRATFTPFAVYRVILGIGLLFYIYIF